jgi:hypothetical protein
MSRFRVLFRFRMMPACSLWVFLRKILVVLGAEISGRSTDFRSHCTAFSPVEFGKFGPCRSGDEVLANEVCDYYP